MAKTTIKLEYILKMANNVEFDSTDVYISKLIYEYYNEIPHYNLYQTLELLNVSKQCFKKYILQIGCDNYSELKDEMVFDKIIRMNQIKMRYRDFQKEKLLSIMNALRNNPIDLHSIDTICEKIYDANRMIFYGSPTLLNLLFDFQIDMKIFGKTILISSVNRGKILDPAAGDLIGICTATGRLLGCCDAQFEDDVLNKSNQKILFTKDNIKHEKIDYTLAMETKNDYYEMHYVFLFYLDLIKTRYYELYVKEK